MSIHIPLPIPTYLHDEASPPSALSEKEQTLYDIVLKHFSAADYTLPNVNEEQWMKSFGWSVHLLITPQYHVIS
jgi:hypothetical protein